MSLGPDFQFGNFNMGSLGTNRFCIIRRSVGSHGQKKHPDNCLDKRVESVSTRCDPDYHNSNSIDKKTVRSRLEDLEGQNVGEVNRKL